MLNPVICDVHKNRKSSTFINARRKNFIAISKSGTFVKSVDDEYSNLTKVYEQVKKVEKLLEKVLIDCQRLFSLKRNSFAEKYDKCND